MASDASICRAHDWKSGTKLIGTERGDGWESTSVILITAVGEQGVLARELIRNGEPVVPDENLWSLRERDWTEIDLPLTKEPQ